MSIEHTISKEDLSNIVQNMLDLAMQQPDVTAAEVGGSAAAGLMAKVRLGEVDVIEFNRDKSLGITIYKGQRQGSASITDLTKPAIAAAVQAACRIAEYTEPDPAAGLADKEFLIKSVPNLDLYHTAGITPELAIEYAKTCEAAALGFDKEITNSEGGVFATTDQFYVYGNSHGLLVTYPSTRYSAYCVVIGQRGENMQRDYDITVARDVQDLMRLETVGKKAAEKTLARLGARKIKTCHTPVIFVPRAATSLWGALVSAISGGNLFRKTSFLLDCLEHKIFPEFINITEQPHILKALGSAPFDEEGVATSDKNIIQDGILKTYLLGSYSARKLGMQTTGNAGGVHNLVIEPGNDDFDQLLKKMQRGLIVTDLMGHGTNIVTGNYSHGATGFWVEDGAIAYPVEEITIAGNLKDIFKQIVAVGSDVDDRYNVVTGSVLIDKMTIGGN